MRDLGPTLHTERLILRPPQPQDLDGWSALMGDPEAARYIGGVQPRAMAWRGMTCMAGAWALQGFGMFSVLEKSTGRWIGRVGPWQPDGWPGAEVGWGLVRTAWGQGFAYEAAVAAMAWVFDVLQWQDVIHCIDIANTASQDLAKRLGSKRRGPGKLPEPFHNDPVEIWGQTRDEFRLFREKGGPSFECV